MDDLTHILTILSRKEAYIDQLKIKRSYEEFTRRATKKDSAQTRTKNCLAVHEYHDISSYVANCLVLSLVALSLEEKSEVSTNSSTNTLEKGGMI